MSYLYLMNNLASSIKAIRHADTELTEKQFLRVYKKKNVVSDRDLFTHLKLTTYIFFYRLFKVQFTKESRAMEVGRRQSNWIPGEEMRWRCLVTTLIEIGSYRLS